MRFATALLFCSLLVICEAPHFRGFILYARDETHTRPPANSLIGPLTVLPDPIKETKYLSSEDIEYIQNATNITSLKIEGLEADLDRILENKEALRTLEYTGTAIVGLDVGVFDNTPNIDKLDLHGNTHLKNVIGTTTSQIRILKLTGTPSLETLNVSIGNGSLHIVVLENSGLSCKNIKLHTHENVQCEDNEAIMTTPGETTTAFTNTAKTDDPVNYLVNPWFIIVGVSLVIVFLTVLLVRWWCRRGQNGDKNVDGEQDLVLIPQMQDNNEIV